MSESDVVLAAALEGMRGDVYVVARRPSDNTELKNTIALYRRLRIQVLDARSGFPVQGEPVHRIWIGDKGGQGKEIVAHYLGDEKFWDLEQWMPMYQRGGQRFAGDVALDDYRSAQHALKALGYYKASVDGDFGRGSKTALLKYRILTGAIVPHPTSWPRLVNLFQHDSIPPAELEGEFVKGIQDASGNPVPFETPTAADMERLRKIYNWHACRAIIFHLSTRGFYPDAVDPQEDYALDDQEIDSYDSWKEPFQRWYRQEFPNQTPVPSLVKSSAVAAKLVSFEKPFVTNDQGMLHIPIPVERIRKGFSVEIQFRDFPLIPEATQTQYDSSASDLMYRQVFRRPDSIPEWAWNEWTQKRTNDFAIWSDKLASKFTPYLGLKAPQNTYLIEWRDGQELGRASPWGWWLNSTTLDGNDIAAQFHTSIEFKVDAFDPDDGKITWSLLHAENRSLSMFYDSDGDNPEFVCWALTWCQPVWQELPATQFWIRGDYDSESPTQRVPRSKRYDLTMPTRRSFSATSETRLGLGREYGRFMPNPTAAQFSRGSSASPRPHTGFDIWGVESETPVFAIHGGKVIRSYTSQGGYGHCVIHGFVIRSRPGSNYYLRYAHLSDASDLDPNSGDNMLNYVMAGQKIGNMGRTFNGTGTHNYPTHVHLELDNEPTCQGQRLIPFQEFANVFEMTHHLRVVFPDNEMLRVFPCDVGDENLNTGDCSLRGGDNDEASSRCWAARKLWCPYLSTDDTRQVQAQLVFLHEAQSDDDAEADDAYLRPGSLNDQIDGGWGPSAKAAIRRFRERQAGLNDPAPLPPMPDNPTQEQQQQIEQYNQAMEAFPADDSATRDRLDAEAPYPRHGGDTE